MSREWKFVTSNKPLRRGEAFILVDGQFVIKVYADAPGGTEAFAAWLVRNLQACEDKRELPDRYVIDRAQLERLVEACGADPGVLDAFMAHENITKHDPRKFLDTVKEARRVWMEENPADEGTDHVTPFDQFLYSEKTDG